MIYYPDAQNIRTLAVPFSRLWYEGGQGLLRTHWFAEFLRDSLKHGFRAMDHKYAACALYGARLKSGDDQAVQSAAEAYLAERLAWFASYDAKAGMSDPLPAAVHADGKIVLLDGHHRAAMMYVRGMSHVTVGVKYVSPAWQRMIDELRAIAGYEYLYAPIAHPWFDGWQTMRDQALGRELAVVAAVGAIRNRIPAVSWYDVGCCTGALCRVAGLHGWAAVGLEYQATFVRVAEALNGFFGTTCTYYQTDRFQDVIAGAERRPGRSVGCISALSILHHWLRDGTGDAAYTDAVQTIADNSWCFVIDQDVPANGLNEQANTGIPLGTDGGDAYSAWLKSAIGCKMVKRVGTFDLGRPVFLCSKVLE